MAKHDLKTHAANDVMEVITASEFDLPRIITHAREFPDQRTLAAFGFIERWGMVAAMESGEDTAGRAKLRLATVDEVVTRAFDMADAAFKAASARGWMVAVPRFAELAKPKDEQRGFLEALQAAKEHAVAASDFNRAAQVRTLIDEFRADKASAAGAPTE